MEDKLCFESNLTEEELLKNFAETDFFTEVMIGLEEALDFCKDNDYSSVVVYKRTKGMREKENILLRIVWLTLFYCLHPVL